MKIPFFNHQIKASFESHCHAAITNYMSGFAINIDLQFDADKSKTIIKTSEDVMTLSVIFLICAHKAYFLKLNEYTKYWILSVFKKQVRHNFREEMNL